MFNLGSLFFSPLPACLSACLPPCLCVAFFHYTHLCPPLLYIFIYYYIIIIFFFYKTESSPPFFPRRLSFHRQPLSGSLKKSESQKCYKKRKETITQCALLERGKKKQQQNKTGDTFSNRVQFSSSERLGGGKYLSAIPGKRREKGYFNASTEHWE